MLAWISRGILNLINHRSWANLFYYSVSVCVGGVFVSVSVRVFCVCLYVFIDLGNYLVVFSGHDL